MIHWTHRNRLQNKTQKSHRTIPPRQAQKNSTELSKHIWTLKNDNIDYSISWHVLSSSSPYNSSSKRCNLCLKEKFLTVWRPDLSSLNKRNDFVSSCQHRNKALLRNSWTFKFLSLPRNWSCKFSQYIHDSHMNILSLNPWRVKWFTKQACRENVVASFFPLKIFIPLSFNVLSTVPRENRLADSLSI